jgi:hypothetical protein
MLSERAPSTVSVAGRWLFADLLDAQRASDLPKSFANFEPRQAKRNLRNARHIGEAARQPLYMFGSGSSREALLRLATLVLRRIIDFDTTVASEILQTERYERTRPEPASKYVHELRPRNSEAARHVRLTQTAALSFIAEIGANGKRRDA